MKRSIATCLTALALILLPAICGLASEVIPASLIPAQMALPASWGIIKTLLIVTFFIHLLLMNILLGSVMLAAFNAWRAAPVAGYGLKKDSSFTTGILSLTVNFGVAPFLFVQVLYGSFVYTSNILMAVWWLAVPLLVMLAYYAIYVIKSGGADSLFRRRLLITVIALLLMLVAFVLTTTATMSIRPERWPGWTATPAGTMLNLGDPTFIPRYLHMLAASLAVGGLFMGIRARWGLRKPGADRAEAEARTRYGLNCFIYTGVAQAFIGFWFLVSLPHYVLDLFIGQSIAATLMIALVAVMLVISLLAAKKGKLGITCGLLAGMVLIMVIVRDIVRDATLTPFNEHLANAGDTLKKSLENGAELMPDMLRQAVEVPLTAPHGQDMALGVFLFCAIIGVVLIGWMGKVAFNTFNGAAELSSGTSGKGE